MPSQEKPSAWAHVLQLKPGCVKISKIALSPPTGSNDSRRELTSLLERLVAILDAQIAQDVSVLDEKLAEYIFFPLSHIFRNFKAHSFRIIELSIHSLEMLISHGWKSKIPAQLVQQLLTLLTFVLDDTPDKEASRDVPEETSIASFKALTALFGSARSSPSGSTALVEESAVPALGHCITVILAGVTDGKSPQVSITALRTIEAVFSAVKDRAALATFLPGTVSALTKVLAEPHGQKNKVLSGCLGAMTKILVRVLGDIHNRGLKVKEPASSADKTEESEESAEKSNNEVLSPAWLKATSSQVKLALATVLKLRTRASDEVQGAMQKLCITLLDECHSSLETCSEVLTETAIVTAPPAGDEHPFHRDTNLEDLVGIHPELAEVVKTVVHDWLTTMPGMMQAADEDAKSRAIRNVSRGIQLVSHLDLDSTTLENSTARSFKDSVMTLISDDKSSRALSEVAPEETMALTTTLAKGGLISSDFPPIIIPHESQSKTRNEVLLLLDSSGSSSQKAHFSLELLDFARESSGIEQVASYWVSFQLLKQAMERSGELDELLDLDTPDQDVQVVFDDMFSFSVSLVDSYMDDDDDGNAVDWRMAAVALEMTSFASARLGESFRPELIDVLYPISTFLGSNKPQLRRHAVICLNVIAQSCGYDSVSSLIIENVDYMVNSIALRLNALDMPPASMKVLTMMVRLAGPKLIPYLDDVVASLFAALDNFHHYPVFAETLFGVLKEIAEQGAKSDKLMIEGTGKRPDHRKRRPEPMTLENVFDMLDKQVARHQSLHDEEEEEIVGYPTESWKEDKPQNQDEQDPGDGAVEKTPNTPTYELLLKIANLTQYYMTSPTPTLRRSLLDLLATVSPALGQDEDAFLPLINSVWPTVVTRLYDDEPYIPIAACDTLCALCVSAGDFLGSRFAAEWSAKMKKWSTKVKSNADAARKREKGKGPSRAPLAPAIDLRTGQEVEILIPGRNDSTTGMTLSKAPTNASLGGLGRFSNAAQTWEACVKLLTAVVAHVRVDAYMYDEILELLADEMEVKAEVLDALESVNADAVWLARYKRGRIAYREAPKLEGVFFPEMKCSPRPG